MIRMFRSIHEHSLFLRVRHARKWKRRRDFVHKLIDGLYYKLLFGYELPHNSRWSLFAELFWIECPVCLFWRGLSFGFFCASALAIALVLIF